MKLSRQVGTASEVLDIFVSDASVTTGAGLANVIGSSVSYSWWHNDQASASTGTASTAGAMGVYSTSAWVQVSSSNALGWYQFGAPNGVFASGRSAAIHFYGAPGMAPLPVEVELTKTDNQTYTSSQSIGNVLAQVSSNMYRIYSANAVTSASGTLVVSTQAIDKGGYGVTTVAANITTNANVLQIYGSAAVTSASGQFRVSTQAIDKAGYGVTSVAFYGTAAVTSGAGILTVSTQTLEAASGGDVSSVYGQPIVTSGAGILLVSTQALTVPNNAGIAAISSAVLNAMPESYRASGAEGTMAQMMYEMVAHLGESSITGTEKVIRNIDHAATAATFTLNDSSAPTAITRAS